MVLLSKVINKSEICDKKLFCVNKFVYICDMFENLHIIKGIHPGFFLEREIKKRNLVKGRFAISIDEFPQTLVSICKGKRRMNAFLAQKIEQKLNLEEGYLMVLQVFFDIKQLNNKNIKNTPDLKKIRPILFWDTNFEKIDWQRNKSSVIKRVLERGNEIEKEEISRFYGLEKN